MRGDGKGGFTNAGTPKTSIKPAGIAVADFDGDGKDDVAVTITQGVVEILRGDAVTGLGGLKPYFAGNGPGSGLATDVTGDGKLDLVFGTREDGCLNVAVGAGDATFATTTTYYVGASPTEMTVGDFNGDGRLDVAFIPAEAAAILILPGAKTCD